METDAEVLDVNTEEASSASSDAPETSSTPKGEKTLDDVVENVLKKHQATAEAKEPTPPVEEEKETPQKTAKEEPSPKEETPEETEVEEEPVAKPDAEVPFNNHPRWKQVLTERNTATAEVERLKPMAEQATALQNFCQTNGIGPEDLQSALELAALSKKDVVAFRKRMGEYIDNIDIAQGSKVPADLQKEVDDGVLSEARAKELAQARLRLQMAEGNVKTEQQRSEESRQATIANSLNTWEESQKKLDPGWDSRREMLAERLQTLWFQSPPKSAQDAIRLAEKANEDVKKRLANFVPKPQKRKPLLSTGSSTTTNQELKIDNLETDLPNVVRAVAAKYK